MPIYAYKCESCGHAKDVLQKISDPLLTLCPSCGAATFQKQLTAAGFQLKGSGWYVTDFRGGSSAAATQDAQKGDSMPTEAPAPGGAAAPPVVSASETSTGAATSSASAAASGGTTAGAAAA